MLLSKSVGVLCSTQSIVQLGESLCSWIFLSSSHSGSNEHATSLYDGVRLLSVIAKVSWSFVLDPEYCSAGRVFVQLDFCRRPRVDVRMGGYLTCDTKFVPDCLIDDMFLSSGQVV